MLNWHLAAPWVFWNALPYESVIQKCLVTLTSVVWARVNGVLKSNHCWELPGGGCVFTNEPDDKNMCQQRLSVWLCRNVFRASEKSEPHFLGRQTRVDGFQTWVDRLNIIPSYLVFHTASWVHYRYQQTWADILILQDVYNYTALKKIFVWRYLLCQRTVPFFFNEFLDLARWHYVVTNCELLDQHTWCRWIYDGWKSLFWIMTAARLQQ